MKLVRQIDGILREVQANIRGWFQRFGDVFCATSPAAANFQNLLFQFV